MNTPWHYQSAREIRDAVRSGAVSATAMTEWHLNRIAEVDPSVDAFTQVWRDEALAQAAAVDEKARKGDALGPLAGVPVGLKELLCTRTGVTSCASKILKDFRSPYDGTVVKRMAAADAVFLGKVNMDEFAMGSSTENSAYKPTKNPWSAARVPGGSSGGSAASVAAGQCFASVGTDTGGSIRQPAAFCGIVGLKPSYGRVSRRGLVAYGSSLDQAGPMTRTVADAAEILQVIAGHDPKDSTSVDTPVPDYLETLRRRGCLKGLRLGLPEQYWGEGLSAEVEAACRGAVDLAATLGAEIVPVSLPHTEYAIATYYILAMAEASSNLARFDGVRYGRRSAGTRDLATMYTRSRCEGFGEEVMRRIMLGTYVLSAGYYDAYYKKAAQVRRLIRQDFLNALGTCDLICGPACPTTAFAIGENTDDPLQMYLTDIFTISLNLSGLPGLSLPVGLGADTGMPVGLQLFGGSMDEARLLSVAASLEDRLPKLPAPPLA